MIDTFYRIILEECGTKENFKVVSRFIAKEFNLSDKKADFIVHNYPAILGDMNRRENAELAIQYLKGLNADCSIKTVVKDKRLPFSIQQRQLKWISKEFSKTLRACVETIFFYVTVEHVEKTIFIPSLLTSKDVLEDTFRYSDSVFVIDDTTFILLGFASDRDGSDVVIDKIINFVEMHISRDIIVNIGISIIPEDGKSFYDLMAVAKKNIVSFKKNDKGISLKIDVLQDIDNTTQSSKTEESASDIQLFNFCLNRARGKFYNELTALPPDVLWGALSRISISDQKRFFLKLPHDSPLTPFLAEKIKTQSEQADIQTARKKVRSLISEMQIVDNLKERSEKQKQIIGNLQNIDTIFNIPAVALQVYKVASDPESDIDDIVSSILLDPSLSMKILKIINSPFYRRIGQIGSIKNAVLILGRDEVINMAFGLSLSTSFLDANLKGFINPDTLWKHSLETAFIARYLCETLPDFKNLGGFTAGLLHDLGKIYLIEYFSDFYKLVVDRSTTHGLLTHSIEQEMIGMDHGIIGYMIGENWNLPTPLAQAIGFHHQPSGAPEYSTFAAIVGFADYLVNMASAKNETSKSKLKQLLKVDHMIMMKKVFSDFGTKFVENTFEHTLKLLDETKQIIKTIS